MVMGDMQTSTDLLVVGGGPGGYAAAIRGAELGLDVALVDRGPQLGGVCLHAGCIPARNLLRLVRLLDDTGRAEKMGLIFAKPTIDLAAIRTWLQQLLATRSKNLTALLHQKGILAVKGTATFSSSTAVRLEGADISGITFKKAIIATGSRPRLLPGLELSPGGKIMDSAAALALQELPGDLLVVGSGYVGLEIGSIYAALGCRVSLMDMQSRLLAKADPDLVAPLEEKLARQFVAIHLDARVEGLQESATGVTVRYTQNGQEAELIAERVLLAIGRQPNSDRLGLDHTEVGLDERGAIKTDDRQQTTDSRIFAAGDVAGGIMLAHKAVRQGRIAAEVIGGRKSSFDVRAIPALVYTEPQIAWCGLTEEEARTKAILHTVQRYPLGAEPEAGAAGFKKFISNPEDGRILGVGLVGGNVEGFIGEAALAIEMGALAEDLDLVLHPYPAMAEIADTAAEIFAESSGKAAPTDHR